MATVPKPVKKVTALSVSSASAFLLLATFPSEPHIPALRIGIICAVISSLFFFFYFWTNKDLETIAIGEASWIQRLLVLAGLPTSAYALYSLFHFAHQIPHVWSAEIGMFAGVACSLFVFIFCYAAPCAYVIREFDFSPRACALAACPFLIIAGVSLLRTFFWNPAFPKAQDFGFISVTLALPITTACRKLAFPGMDPADIWRSPRLFPR